MKFIYGNGVMMHVRFIRMSLCVEMLLPSDCLNINEFRQIQMNTHSDAHGYSLEQSYCLYFNSLSNLLV